MSSGDTTPIQRLAIDKLPRLSDFGFTGGRLSFLDFCRSVFRSDTPRFLRTDDNNLVVFRHADLRAMAALPQMGNVPPALLHARVRKGAEASGYDGAIDERLVGEAMANVFANQFFFNNEPIHTPLRRITLTQIGPKAVPGMLELAQKTVREILGEVPRGTKIDFVMDIAERLTVRFWGELIGLSRDEKVALGALLRTMSSAFSLKRDPTELRLVDDAFAAYDSLVQRAALRSIAFGDRPFVQAFATQLKRFTYIDDPEMAGIMPRNAGKMLAGLLTDGFHTAAVAAANVVHVLVRRPEVYAAVKSSPDLWNSAIAEALRVQTPVLMLNRYTLSDVVYDGFRIPARTVVVMMWGAGNQDPAFFENPEEFLLNRSSVGATTFGGGAQICPGRHAAGMLARVLLDGLDEAGLDVEPACSEDAWVEKHIMTQLAAFPAILRQR